MKIFIFIFSFYLLALPGINCVESFGCTNEMQNSYSQSGNSDKHQNEDCGSFCTCACCVHVITANQVFAQVTTENIYNFHHKYFFYNNISIPANYLSNIWQPPRIS